MPYAPMPRRLLAFLLSAALVLTGLAVAGVVTTTAASASASSMLSQVNAARAKQDLAPYKWNPRLAAVAGEQVRRMALQNRLFHNPRLAGDVANFRSVGENVGFGSSSSVVQKAFMKSPAHRANILSNYTQIGIAQLRDSAGRLWVAQVFRTPSGSASTKPKPNATKAKPIKKAKKAVAAKPSTAAKRTTATRRTAPVKPTPVVEKRAAAPVVASPAADLTWADLALVLRIVNLMAAVTGSPAAAVPRF